MNLSSVALAAQTEGLSLAEKGITSAKVVLTGFVVVFAMLILLIFIIKIYSAIVQKAQSAGSNSKKGKDKKDEKTAEKVDLCNAKGCHTCSGSYRKHCNRRNFRRSCSCHFRCRSNYVRFI